MKKILISFTILFPLIGSAQTGPAGVGNTSNNEIWLVADSSFTDAGVTLGTNNSTIQQWNDISGNANQAIQTTASLKPTLKNNQANGFSSLLFDGLDDRILSSGVTTSDELTLFVVVKFNNLRNNNDGIIQGSPSGNAFTGNGPDKSVGMWINRVSGRIWGRGVQADNSQISIPQTTTLSTGQFYTITQDYDGSLIRQYVDGSITGTVPYNGTLKSWTEFGIGNQGGESLEGELCEIIAFTNSVNAAQKIIIQNYLSAKYGLALSSNDLYDEDNGVNGDYDFEVAGIGRVDIANVHNEAQGTGILRMLNPSGLGDNEFLIWGHDNGIQKAVELTDVPIPVQARLDRVWRVSEVDASSSSIDVGPVDIRFDLSGLGNVTASDLRLLVDADNDGVFANETPIGGATALGGNIYQFAGVTALANSRRFTIGTINTGQTPLPISLINFTAKAINNEYVELNWQTASEINNNFFTVERSIDVVDWEAIKEIDGAGSSSLILSYEMFDTNPHFGISYYRIKQTDFDGKLSYSKVSIVNLKNSSNNKVMIYPNPANNQIIIKGDADELRQAMFFTELGQDVTTDTSITESNKKKITIDISKLASGVYYVKTKTAVNILYKQ